MIFSMRACVELGLFVYSAIFISYIMIKQHYSLMIKQQSIQAHEINCDDNFTEGVYCD